MISTIDHSIKHETTICMIINQSSLIEASDRSSQWHVNRQFQLCTNQLSYWHSSNRHSIEASDRSFSTWHINSFIFRIFHLVQQHVIERVTVQLRESVQSLKRAKNKSIQQEIEAMNIIVKKSKSAFRNCRLAHFIIYFEILHHRERFMSHVSWEVEINESATTSNARMFFAQFWLIQFRKQWSLHTFRITSYLNATISFAFKMIKFEIFKSTHARESLSRQFSISIHVSRFSKISHSTSICRRC